MLYDQNGVTDVRQIPQGLDQPLVIALVEADTRLVQDVGDAGKLATDLGRQADALGFAAGKRAAGAVEAQVAQAYVQ